MKKDGTLAAIHKKWFVDEPTADSCAINECAPYMPNEKPAVGGAAAPAATAAPVAEAPMMVIDQVAALAGSAPSRVAPSKWPLLT